MRDLGSIGESAFKLWCDSVGLIANPSLIDKTGWDFNVEFPFIPDPLKDLDQQEGAIECKFQVKSTDNKTKKVQVKLSNLQRFVKTQLPAFFILIEFDKQDEPQNAYVLHVEENLIGRVLKRLREVDVSGQSDKLHKKKMTICFKNAEKITPLKGKTLQTLITKNIGRSTETYVKSKITSLETIGYENGRGKLTFSVPKGDYEKLINVSLGIEKEFDVENCVAINTRFGIESKKPLFEIPKGKASFTPKPFKKGKASFKAKNDIKSYNFPISAYGSSLNNFVLPEEQKYRIQSDFFDLIFNFTSKNTRFKPTLTGNKKLKILKLKKYIDFLYFLSSSKSEIMLKLQLKKLPLVEAKINTNNVSLIHKDVKQLVDNTVFLSRFFHLSNPKIKYDDLERNCEDIHRLFSMINIEAKYLNATFNIEEDKLDIKKELACYAFLNTTIGNYLVGIIIIIYGSAEEIEPKHYSLQISKINKEHQLIVDTTTEKNLKEILDAKTTEIEDKLEKQKYQIIRL